MKNVQLVSLVAQIQQICATKLTRCTKQPEMLMSEVRVQIQKGKQHTKKNTHNVPCFSFRLLLLSLEGCFNVLPFDLLSSAAEQFTFSVLCDPVDTHLFSIKHPITSIRSPWVLEQNVSFSFLCTAQTVSI